MRSRVTTLSSSLSRMVLLLAAAASHLRPRSWAARAPIARLCASVAADDERFMRIALREAEKAYAAGEVPIGAVLVRGGEALVAERNRVEELSDASAHAEMNCMRAAAKHEGWRLAESTLYCTVEPCPMCLAAVYAFRVPRLVYGTTNPRLGAVESATALGVPAGAHPFHDIETTGGVLADDAAELMKSFFRKRRASAPEVEKPGSDADAAFNFL